MPAHAAGTWEGRAVRMYTGTVATAGWDEDGAALSAERARLVRLCARLTGDAQAAEDLAQDTLLVAFQRERALRDPARRAQWLSGVARNLCMHWRRSRGLEAVRFTRPRPADDPVPALEDGPGADDFDPETALERAELVALLDRALALLPPETREALVHRYVRESSHGEVAARLGVSEEAVKKRVERGKLALRHILGAELRQDALPYGLIDPRGDGWRETRMWCPGCGRRKLVGRFRPDEGELYLRCPACSPPGTQYIGAHNWGDGFKDLRAHKPAVSRVLRSIHDRFHLRSANGAIPCPTCGDWLPIREGTPPAAPSGSALPPEWTGADCIHLWCPRCGLHNVETWHSLTWSLPEARRFWRDNPRMRFLPGRELEVAGSPAVLTGFESLTGGARLEVVSLRDTYRVLSVDGADPSDAFGA